MTMGKMNYKRLCLFGVSRVYKAFANVQMRQILPCFTRDLEHGRSLGIEIPSSHVSGSFSKAVNYFRGGKTRSEFNLRVAKQRKYFMANINSHIISNERDATKFSGVSATFRVLGHCDE